MNEIERVPWLGIEKSARYTAMARQRIDAARAQERIDWGLTVEQGRMDLCAGLED